MFLFTVMCFSMFGEAEWQVNLDNLNIFGYDGFSSNQVAVADDGSLLFKDQKEARLIFTDAKGVIQKIFGRKGMGPDEFHLIDGIGWVDQYKAFFVTDRGTLRVSKFSKGGEPQGHFRSKILRSPVFADSGHVFYMKRSGSGSPYENSIHALALEDQSDQRLFTTAMEPIATMMVWHGRLVFAPGKDFLVASHSDFDKIHILDPKTGKTLQQWPLKVPRIPIGKDWRDSYMKDFNSRVFAKGSPPPGFRIDHRDEWPYLQTIQVDAQDRIWIFLHRANDETATPYRVYDRHGKRLKAGKLQGWPQQISQDFLYLLRQNEKGTALVHKALADLD